MTDLLDRRNSVTRDDYLPTTDQGVFSWTIYDPSAMQSPVPQLPFHGSRERDRVLTATLDLEDMWASAVNKAVTKIAVRGYEVSDNDDSTRRTEAGQALARDFDGPAEYRSGMAKVVQDFLLTDNGWFVEIARVSQKPGAKVQALYHLDSFRCFRTGNLDYPVLYLDWEGGWHKLRADQVIFGSDMPSPRARMFNRGRCAASRAFQTIVKLSAVETYFREKITGSRALALYFVTGVSRQQLQDAMETSEAEKIRKGHIIYKGAVMIPLQGDTPIAIQSIDLASIPDGFEVDQERKDAYLRYANALGVPVQDIQPLSGQGLGTGTQTIVLDEAAEGQGLAFFVKDFEDKINHLVMPKQTIFQIKVNDVRDQSAQATLNKSKADTLVALLSGGVISQAMALQMAVDDGLVPAEFLPQDVTPAGVLTDSGDQSKAPQPTPRAPYAGVVPPPAQPAQVMKAIRDAYVADGGRLLSADEILRTKADDPDWEEAVKWAEEATNGESTA
jgi:hypothetical protein